MIKFRTMRADAEAATGPVWCGKGDSRITRSGDFLRKTRLDELPQFINVLKGEMSLIGPRPERPGIANRLEDAVPYFIERTYEVAPALPVWHRSIRVTTSRWMMCAASWRSIWPTRSPCSTPGAG